MQCDLKVSINFFVLSVLMQHVNFVFRKDDLGRVDVKGWMEDHEKKQFSLGALVLLVQENFNFGVACRKFYKSVYSTFITKK